MQKDQQKLMELIKGKKVAFIGAGVSHKTLIKEFVELGAHVTLCDQKKSVEEFGDYAATIRELGLVGRAILLIGEKCGGRVGFRRCGMIIFATTISH